MIFSSLRHVAQVAVALQPVGQLFPTAVAFLPGVGPGVALEAAPGRHLGQPAGHAVGFEFELLTQPAVRRDAPDGQLEQRTGRQGRPIDDVQAAGLACLHMCHDMNVVRLRR